MKRTRTLIVLVLAAAVAGVAPGVASAARAHVADHWRPAELELGGYAPYTNWRRPILKLPAAAPTNFLAVAEEDVAQAWHWSNGHGWYCGYLRCAHGPYPIATIWSEVHYFQAVDALQIAAPSPAHAALVRHFGWENTKYWDWRMKAFAPYPGSEGRHANVFFDDSGWLGLALVEAYRATGEHRWLGMAQKDFRFIAAHGWDRRHGGMWWNTWHTAHSGIAIAVDSLLGTLLYLDDGETWQARTALKYINWSHTANEPYWREPFIAAPIIYAEQMLCERGFGAGYCVDAGRMAATLAEEDERGMGGVREFAYNYGPQYDTAFLQWMLAYGQATGETFWLHLAEVNAAAAAVNARGSGLFLGSWWGGPFGNNEVLPHEFQTAGATGALLAWTAVYSQPAG
jgi:hypothetical protein